MKKLISILLFVSIVFSFCMTGASASALSLEEITEKYGALIDAIEAGDYDAAEEEFEKLIPEPEEPEFDDEDAEPEAIELTTENFLDYFELVQSESYIDRNSSGKIKSVYPGSYQLVLKEEYRDRYDWGENEMITIGIKAKAYFHRAKIDFKTGEIKLNEDANSDVRKAIKKEGYELSLDTQVTGYDDFYISGATLFHKEKWYGSTYWWSGAAEPGTDYKYYQEVWKVNVVSVSGTLYLKPAA